MASDDNGILLVEGNNQVTYTLPISSKAGIMKVMARKDLFFYSLYDGLDRKLMVYNRRTQENKLFIDERVLDFQLSSQNDYLILEIDNKENELTTLQMVDLKTHKRRVLVEDQMIYGLKISPDGRKFAYINNSRIDRAQGLYVIDLEALEKYHISSTYTVIDGELF